jgi:hypothetical protein
VAARQKKKLRRTVPQLKTPPSLQTASRKKSNGTVCRMIQPSPATAEENATHRVALKDPTLNGVGRKPTDRKSRLIRTLTNLKEDPEACNQSAESADSADCSRQQFQPVRVALIPPRVIGDDPGLTPRIHAVSDVVSPRPERIARSAACSRARKPAGSADSADGADGAMGPVGRVSRLC